MNLFGILEDFHPVFIFQEGHSSSASVVKTKAFVKGLEKHVLTSGKFKKDQKLAIANQIEKAALLFREGREMEMSSPSPFRNDQGQDMPYNCHVFKSSDKKASSYIGDFWVLSKLHVFWRKNTGEGLVEFFGFGYPSEYGF